MSPPLSTAARIAFSKPAFLAEAAEIQRHPAFPEALVRWGDVSLAPFDGRPRDAKLICQTARYVTLFFILHLHASADPDDPDGGASVARVQASVEGGGFASGSWVKLAIRTFQRSGLIEPMAPGSDRRLRRFRPTDHFLELGRTALLRGLRLVALVRPLSLPPDELAHYPGVVENVARVTVETYEREGFTNLELIPEITAFLQRDFGHLILSHLMLTLRDDPSLGPWARAPASELSTRFGVSRAHVRNVLQMGEDLGLVKGQTRGGRIVRLTPRFVELTRQWVAIDLAWMRYLAEGAYVHARRPTQG